MGSANLTSYVSVLRAHGYREEARAFAKKIIARIRDLPPDEQVEVRESKAHLLLETDRAGEAASINKELASEKGGNIWEEMRRLGDLGVAAAAAGDRARARKISNDFMRLRNEGLGAAYFQQARISARLSDKEQAVELLNKAFADGWAAWLSFYQLRLAEDYAFDSMRGYAPFDVYLKSKD